nr:hypothetical protein BaRGS_027713 [Batillaria attramentaria]
MHDKKDAGGEILRNGVAMRFSLRKAVLWVTGLVAVQLGLYVWFSLSTRARINHSPRLIELRRQLYADDTCHRQVREGGLVVFGIPGNQCVRCVLNTTIAELLKNPERRFIFIEMAFFARWWREIDDGRLEIVNGGWVMSDAAVTYYNDIIDQHTLGFDFLRDILGTCAQSRVAWHVDQFGHSREHAAIFAQMGFDALFVGRIDFQDHKQRQASKTLEFVWDTSANDINEKGNLFTHVTYDGYYAPKGFVLDGVKNLFGASKFRTQHLLMPMGSDFGYRVASDWFNNMDKLIKLINVKVSEDHQNDCYIQHVNRANLSWTVKRDDFHPYAISPGHYWTGYFTSRAGQKLLTKRAGLANNWGYLHVSKMLTTGRTILDVMEEAYTVLLKGSGGQKPVWTHVRKRDFVIENKYLKVTFDGATGRLKEVHNLATDRSVLLSQDFAYYMASDSSSRSSGAYVFVPERHVPTRVGGKDPVSVRLQQDVARDVQLTILPDRSQAGSSLYPGTMELLVHRRLSYDDGLGVGENLDERGPDEEGIIYTGKHYLFVDTLVNSVILTRQMALNVHFAPTLTFTKVTEEQKPLMAGLQREKSFLRDSLPPNIQVLTLDYTRDNDTEIYLLRLEHIYEAHESKILSTTASVSLKSFHS